VERLERRRSPRVPATNPARLPIGLRDVSLSGFAIETKKLLPINSVQEFRLAYPDGRSVILRARVAYSRRESGSQGSPIYVTGAEFLADVTARRSPVARPLAS